VGEDGLVAVAVFFAVFSVDVGGEGHVAYFVEDGEEVGSGGEAEGALAEVCGGCDFSFEDGNIFVVKEEALAGLDFAAGADEGGPVVCGKLLG